MSLEAEGSRVQGFGSGPLVVRPAEIEGYYDCWDGPLTGELGLEGRRFWFERDGDGGYRVFDLEPEEWAELGLWSDMFDALFAGDQELCLAYYSSRAGRPRAFRPAGQPVGRMRIASD